MHVSRHRTALTALAVTVALGVTACDAQPDGTTQGTVSSATTTLTTTGDRVGSTPTTPIVPIDALPSTAVPEPTTTTIAKATVLPVNPSIPTTVPLPQPVAPPVDENAAEPVVERGRVAVPSIGIDAALYEGLALPTFDLGPSLWPGTAMPGQIGNMVIGGHRTSANADFRHLDQLVAGDEMLVTDNAGVQHTYAVDSIEYTDPFA
ncbi:MAG: sortase, partial [Ilumatobacter sp.]